MLDNKRFEDITKIQTKIVKLEEENNLLNRENNRLRQENSGYKNTIMMFDLHCNKIHSTAAFPFSLSPSQEILPLDENISELLNVQQETANKITDNYESVSQLNIGLHSIEEAVSLIQEISEQTDQLGINIDSIATRTEEYGPELKTLANLVMTLATRTQEATQEITINIQSLKQNSMKIYEYSSSIESVLSTGI
ncbi:methyl-accepting chemotaxis protein [bacterium]|nr:methyl-accepting chemotaxis protein [bacterium]MBU1882865.1 methyl-accepting chemotaxis protein [bacterium]